MNSTSTLYNYLKFDPVHLELMDARAEQEADRQYLLGMGYEGLAAITDRALSLAYDGQIIGSSGLVPKWPGVWVGWALVSKTMAHNLRHAYEAFRATRNFIDEAMMNDDCHRVECTVLLDFEKGHTYAKKLGFKAEGVLRCYDPRGRDHVMYSRIKHGY